MARRLARRAGAGRRGRTGRGRSLLGLEAGPAARLTWPANPSRFRAGPPAVPGGIALATGGCGTGRPRPSGAGTSRRWTAGGQEPAVRRARPSTPCTGAAVCPGPLELCPVQGRGLGEWGLVLADPVGRCELECRLSQDHPPAGRAGQRPLRPAGGFPAGRGGFSSGAVSPRNR